MSTVASISNCTVTIKRLTAMLLEAIAVAASHTMTRQPLHAGPVQVEVTGTPTGTVTVAGTVNGLADTEVLTWAGTAGVREVVKPFSAISGLTTSLTGGTLISVKSVGPGGAPQNVLRTVVSGMPANRQIRGSQGYTMLIPGMERKEGAKFLIQYEETWRPRAGDLVIVDGLGDEYEAVGAPRAVGDFTPDHWVVQADLHMGRA